MISMKYYYWDIGRNVTYLREISSLLSFAIIKPSASKMHQDFHLYLYIDNDPSNSNLFRYFESLEEAKEFVEKNIHESGGKIITQKELNIL